MDKEELIREMSHRTGFAMKDCREIFDVFLEILKDLIKNRTELAIRGFGKLSYYKVAAHKGIKPITGRKGYKEEIDIPEIEKVKFKLSYDLRDIVKDRYREEDY